jgi:hypothetical protein
MKASKAAKATQTRKTTIEVDAEVAAKLRAMLRALGTKKTADTFITECLREMVESEPAMGYIPEHVHGVDEWANHPKRREMRAKLQRIANGDRRLVHSEPIPRNTAIFSQTFQRLVGAAREKGSTPNNMATQLVEWGLNQIEAGEITFGHNQMEGGEA